MYVSSLCRISGPIVDKDGVSIQLRMVSQLNFSWVLRSVHEDGVSVQLQLENEEYIEKPSEVELRHHPHPLYAMYSTLKSPHATQN